MYEEYFHLSASPFSLGPDPDGVYVTPAIREALAVMAYGVSRRKGFILLTGDVGTGKTTILHVFMRWLQAREATTALIFNPHLGPEDFLEMMLHDFGLEKMGESKSQWMLRFNRWLLERYQANKAVVLLVDEAQQLSEEVLEELRLLTNLETPMHKLLQIVLCGQPELEELLARPSLRQLRQRISLACNTTPLVEQQTGEYIAQRLRASGATRTDWFSTEAVGEIHRIAGGIPRVVNMLCEQLLIEAYCDNRAGIDRAMVRAVARQNGLLPGENHESESGAECTPITQARTAAAFRRTSLERIP
jgi:type II secretory pathway predicted ATPase ExeA